jgi:hypothetical protein
MAEWFGVCTKSINTWPAVLATSQGCHSLMRKPPLSADLSRDLGDVPKECVVAKEGDRIVRR